MPTISVTKEVYDRIMSKTNKKKNNHHPDKISGCDIIKKALDDQEKYNKIMENVV